jgi:FixJ family two-component response regulator
MSGYTDRVQMDAGAVLLEKPFTSERLMEMVKEAVGE